MQQQQLNSNNGKNQEHLPHKEQSEQKCVNPLRKTTKIALIYKGVTYIVGANLIDFSELLKWMQSEDQSLENDQNGSLCDNSGQNSRNSSQQQSNKQKPNTNITSLFSITIPTPIFVNHNLLTLIEDFIKYCQYSPQTVKLQKIKSSSIRSLYCSNQVNDFIKDKIAPLSKETLNQLIQLCRYLQIGSLIEVIYFHLAGKYSCPIADQATKQLLQKYNVKRLNNEEATDLKLKYFDYFKKLSSQIKEKKEEMKLMNENEDKQG